MSLEKLVCENGVTPNDIFDRVNSLIDKVNTNGYAVYTDTEYTLENPFVIPNGQRLKIPNNAVVKNDTNLPFDMVKLFDETTQKLVSINENDEFSIRIRFDTFTTSNTGYAEIDLDIGGSLGSIMNIPVFFPRGAGQNNVRKFSEMSKYFTGSTFISNGGELFIESVRGNTNIFNISFYISRTYKAPTIV